jgi:hypothetical protein
MNTASQHLPIRTRFERWLVAFANANAAWHPYVAGALWRARVQERRR